MFSVVIPVHDKPHTILRTVESVLAQSFPEFELALVGDPEDESLAAAARFMDRRIRIVHQTNIRQGPARNAGIQASAHDWIAFIDADDLWLPGHLGELDRIRKLHPESGLIGTSYLETDAVGRFERPGEDEGIIAHVCYFEEVGRGRNPLCASSAAIHRRAYDRLGGFGDSRLGEDSEYWARIAFAFPVATSDRVTAIYVHGTGGITESARHRWKGAELSSARDLSPAVALVVDRYAEIESRKQRRSIDLFIRRYLDWCLRTSIAIGDYRTVRRLRAIYWGRPTATHALLIAIAGLPDRLAGPAYSFGFRLKSMMRGWRRAALRILRAGRTGA